MPRLDKRVTRRYLRPLTLPSRYVYYFPIRYRCCDAASELVSATGTSLCAPDGGITGHGFGCPDLWTVAKRVRLVWADSRPAPSAGGL